MNTCTHDFTNPVRKGRMRYHCPMCDADISLTIMLSYEAELGCTCDPELPPSLNGSHRSLSCPRHSADRLDFERSTERTR